MPYLVAPSYGIVSYNGETIPGTYQLKLNSTAIYNPDSVNLKYYVNTLTVEFILTQELVASNGTSIDDAIARYRSKLQEPRKALYITYQGSGLGENGIHIYPNTDDKKVKYPDILVDGNQEPAKGRWINDINGGPLPKILNWEPVGVNRACAITWTVEFYTLRCPYGNQIDNDFDESLISFEWDLDQKTNAIGEIGVVISGYIEFPSVITEPTKQDLRTYIKTEAQVWWALFERNILFNPFYQTGLTSNIKDMQGVITQFDTKLNKNGKKIDFIISISPQHSINSLFQNSVKIEAKHSISSSLTEENGLQGSGFFSWLNKLRVSVTIPANTNPSVAFFIFSWIFWQRFGRIAINGIVDPNVVYNQTTTGAKPKNIILSMEIEEDIYGHTHNFFIEYTGIYALHDLLNHSGLFKPIYTIKDKNNKFPWEAGYVEDINEQRKLFHETVTGTYIPSDKKSHWGRTPSYVKNSTYLFDPCHDILDPDIPSQNDEDARRALGDWPIANGSYINTFTPYQDLTNNYVDYHVEFRIIEMPHTYAIGRQENNKETDGYKISTSSEIRSNNPRINAQQGMVLYGKDNTTSLNNPSAVTADSGGSNFIIILKGYGIRYNHPVPVPALLDWENNPLKRVGNPDIQFTQKGIENGVLHITKWEIPYHIPRAITGALILNDGGSRELVQGGRHMPPFNPPPPPPPPNP